MKMLLNDFFSTYFTFDSKLFKSIKYLVAKPSFLSLEYLNGKIEAYLRPIRLYIFISFAFFILSGITSSSEGVVDALNLKQDGKSVTYEELQDQVKANAEAEQTATLEEKGEFDEKIEKIFSDKREAALFLNYLKSKLPILLFIIIPVFGFLLYLCFYNKQYYYIDHLVFALHLQSFFFVLLMVTTIIDFIFNTDLAALAFLGLLIYGYIAARRFYKRGKFSTFFRLSLAGFFHSILSLVIFTIFILLVMETYDNF